MNPWGITEAQARTLDALIQGGSYKDAARITGLSVKTLEVNAARAKGRMGQPRLKKAMLEWAVWKETGKTYFDAPRGKD